MRAKYGHPMEFGKLNRVEENFKFEEKLEHIKAALDKKILDLEKESGKTLTPEERAKVTLTAAEYDKYRDKNNSLTGQFITKRHSWQYALEQAGIPLKTNLKETLDRGEIKKRVLGFVDKFRSLNGREPIAEDYARVQKEWRLPAVPTIKKVYNLTLADFFVFLGITPGRRSALANLPYHAEKEENIRKDSLK